MAKVQDAEDLCDICSNLDLESYFRGAKHSRLDRSGRPGATPDAVKLGSFEDVYAKSFHCRLCDIVVCAICNFRSWTAAMPDEIVTWARQRDGGCMDLWLYSYRFAADTLKTGQREAFRIGFASRTGLGDDTRSIDGDHIGDIQLFCGDAVRLTGSSLFHGRIVSTSGLNMELPRLWLESCEGNHMELCQLQQGSVSQPCSARVVDVRNRCVCNMPEAARYFALSYCWPVGATFKLLRENLSELQQAGSLVPKMNDLPATIRDAINFVYALGEAYLWIDALCIVQDDDDDKKVQLNQMDRIYGSALVTLVCAPATQDPIEACAGLPCYRQGTRVQKQVIVSAKGLRLLVPFEAVISLQLLSRWSSRAWTYQELLLSKRLIFFTDTQIYFRCSVGVFCEDSCGEDAMRGARICPAGNLWNPGGPYTDRGTDHAIDSMYIASSSWPAARIVDNYAQHVDEYTQRQMSLPSDILNAFAGIQNAMQVSMDTHFLHGLPLRYIDKCLLWTLNGSHERRHVANSSVEVSEFPSWSWAGWHGSASMLAYLNVTVVRSEIPWYLIDQRGKMLRLEIDNFPQLEEFPQPNNKTVSVRSPIATGIGLQPFTEDAPADAMAFSDLTEPRSLACWSAIARFRIDGTSVPLRGHSVFWHDAVNLKLFDETGRWAGSIMADPKLSQELLQLNRPRILEFMLVSRSLWLQFSEGYGIKAFDTEVFEERSWCNLNVMLIERKTNGRARRLTIGVIHEDAWVLACPTSTFLRLE